MLVGLILQVCDIYHVLNLRRDKNENKAKAPHALFLLLFEWGDLVKLRPVPTERALLAAHSTGFGQVRQHVWI